ncbi:F-box/WD repeat-containing protein [Criblamydia sequanensis]|uniref:F-box domain-containing protein n=1 Tax=Candidatus Criblamydia sequanensis CRIB-18 TaxID=1437425 RepID=A0A090D1L2_9BACT|nr:F-box/WD40 repeat-containing protein [Criblamydia sequanensis]CDR33895.1 hypothetical protein CSEC_1069 [Criblamydia sequanensis CRIB-18]
MLSSVNKTERHFAPFSEIEDLRELSECGETATANLPDEIVLNILSYLDFLSLHLKTGLTCRRWKRLSYDKALLKLCFFRSLEDSAKTHEQECLERNALARSSTSKRSKIDDTEYFFYEIRGDLYMRSKKFQPTWAVLNLEEFQPSSWAIECMKIREDLIYSSAHDNTIQVWDRDSGKRIMRLEGHNNRVSCLQVDLKYIYSGSWDNTIRVWDKESGSAVKVLEGHKNSVSCLQVANGKAYSGGYDNKILIWDMESGKVLQELEGHLNYIKCLEVADGIIYSFTSTHVIHIWNSESGELLKKLVGPKNGISSIRILNGKIYIGCCDGKIRIWESKSGNQIKELEGHESNVIYLQVLDGKIISASRDKTIRIWDAESGEMLKRLDGRRPGSEFFVSIHIYRGKIYAEYNDGILWVWEFI